MCMVGSKMSQRREIERENEIVGHRERERGGGVTKTDIQWLTHITDTDKTEVQ